MLTMVKLADPDGRIYHELKVKAKGFELTKLLAEPEGKVEREKLREVETELEVETD